MNIFRNKYVLGDADFFNIRNRNEGRVVKVLHELIQKKNNALISNKDLQDIYALTLNALPARYVQRGTIVLRDPVSKAELYAAVEDAYDRVMAKPKP